MKVSEIAIVDSETTGLDSDRHEIWDLSIITADHSSEIGIVNETEHTWMIDCDLSTADPTGLRVGRYYERTKGMRPADFEHPSDVAEEIAYLLDGRMVIGAVPDFDTRFLTRLLRRHGHVPTWHYHLVDVENLVAGYLAGKAHDDASVDGSRDWTLLEAVMPPYKSEDLSRLIGVEPNDFERHTSMGDCRWVLAQLRAVYG